MHGVLYQIRKADLKKMQVHARTDGFVLMPIEVRVSGRIVCVGTRVFVFLCVFVCACAYQACVCYQALSGRGRIGHSSLCKGLV